MKSWCSVLTAARCSKLICWLDVSAAPSQLHQTLFFGFRQGNWLDSNHRLIFLAETIGSNCFMKLRCLKPGPSKISAAKLVLLFFLPVLTVGKPSRVSQNLDLRCLFLDLFPLRPIKTLLRPVLLDRGFFFCFKFVSFSISPSLNLKIKITGR